jgi:hypothetical protein
MEAEVTDAMIMRERVGATRNDRQATSRFASIVYRASVSIAVKLELFGCVERNLRVVSALLVEHSRNPKTNFCV